MDFSFSYTPEQEEFRKEVREWLDAHAPRLGKPGGPGSPTDPLALGRGLRRDLGARGWLAPTYPVEYGGGGLTEDHAIVLTEELAPWNRAELGGLGLSLVAPALMAHGTEEQKQKFLPPILKGEVTTLQLFSEPEAGSDLSSLKTTAIRDGDEFVIVGQKVFKEQWYQLDYLYILAVTDPDGPPRESLSAFLIPTTSRGITAQYRALKAWGEEESLIVLDNVRVAPEYLLGEENEGWRMAQTSLELERGGMGSIEGPGSLLEQIIGITRTSR